MVVDNLQNVRALNIVHCLGHLIMVNQYNLPALDSQQVPAGYHAHIFPILIQNREIPVSFLRHNLFDNIGVIIQFKKGQIFPFHKIFYRHTLVHQPCRRIRIMRRADNRTSLIACQPPYSFRYGSALTYNDACRLHFYRTELRLVAVSQNHQIILLNVILHQIRVRRCHQHLPFQKICMFIPGHQASVQRFYNIFILRLSRRQNGTVIHIHVRFRNRADCNQTFQAVVLCSNRQRIHILIPHQRPRFFQGNISVYPLYPADIHVAHSGTHIRYISGNLHSKAIQYVLRLVADDSRALRHEHPLLRPVLKVCIGNRGTDRICIGIFMPHHINLFVLHINFLPAFIKISQSFLFPPSQKSMVPVPVSARKIPTPP